MKRYIIIAGEASGDIYGGSLMKNMQECHQERVAFWGVGGEKMCAQGLFPLEDMNNISVVGFTEIFKKILSIIKLFNRLAKFAEDIRPAGLILIDFPGFNIRLAKKLKKKLKTQFPIIYFISPQVWAWNEGRIKIIKKYIDKMLVIFPFEEEFYKKHNIDVTYLGHPFLDDWNPTDKKELKKKLGFGEIKKLIGVFPGSRSEEIKKHLPIYIKAINYMQKNHKNYVFALGLAPSFDKKIIEQNYNLNNIKIIADNPLLLLECSDMAIVTSGTISLQASLMRTPCVVGYKLSFLSWILSFFLIRVKYISMTNIIANKMVIPELIQYNLTAHNIIKEVDKLLNNEVHYDNVNKQLMNVKNVFLDKQNSIHNAANIIKEICNEKN